jgi:hypothetical protein
MKTLIAAFFTNTNSYASKPFEGKIMSHLFARVAPACILLVLAGCAPTIDSFRYMATGKGAEPPVRTIEAAQAQFNDASLVIGQSTESNLKALLGSPSEIRKAGDNSVHVYLKSVSTQGVSVDVGTTYVAMYSFGKNGKLNGKEYVARPMGNPLTGH